jgi:DNA-binding SARP family transcriptional activator/tetratricopeptide (TPR) repeat protein
MELRFDLLGPLAVARDGQPVPLGSGKQQLVLAALLFRADVIVTVDELVVMLWGDQPPASARANVRTYVRGLRQALGCSYATEDRIVTAGGGYQLRVFPDERDIDRFDAAVGRGRAALAAGDPEQAHAELTAALGMWRGPALAGLPLPRQLARQVAQLEERRLLAEEDHVEVSLAVGAPNGVIPRLRALLDRHPLRQRAWAQLMLGLYRTGDVAGALAAYQQARQAIAEQTGMEPGPELARLHDDILHHRPGPTPPRPATDDPSAGGRPEQLPLAVAGFIGRQAELERLDALVDEPADGPTTVVISAISGMAGIGKTALALHWAHRAAPAFPGGHLYANLRGYDGGDVVSPADVLIGFLEALGVPPDRIPTSNDARTGLYRSLLASREMLIVLDNARDADQVRPLLPGAGRCVVLVTSRDRLHSLVAAEGARPLILDVLTAEESLSLLRSRLGADRLAAEPAAVSEMIEATGRLPLALAIVSARVATRSAFSLDAVAAELRPVEARLEALADGDVRRVFSWSYQALSVDGARMFRLLGLHPGPDLSIAAAVALAGRARSEVAPLLRELTRLHLLTEQQPGRYAFHDLLRLYAAELAQSADEMDERHAARQRLYDHYLHHAYPAARLLQPHWTPIDPVARLPANAQVPPADQDSALAWFGAERRVLLRVVRQAAEVGFEAYAWQLAWALTTFLAPRGLWQDQLSAQQSALAAAERLGDETAQALANRMMSRAASRLGDHTTAEHSLQRALQLSRSTGDRTALALTLHSYTEHCSVLGRLDEAIGYGREALRLYRLEGNRPGEGRALNAVGYLCAVAGDHAQAIADCSEALALQREIGDRNGLGATLDSLGVAYQRLGEYARAVDCYEESVALFRESADRYHEAETLLRLGDCQVARDELTAATEAWRRAAQIYQDLGDPAADEAWRRLAAHPDRGAEPIEGYPPEPA